MCEVAQRFAGWLGLRTEHPGGARVRLRALGRARIPGRRRRGDPAADAPPARGEGRLPLPDRRGPRRGTRGHRAPIGRRVRAARSPSSPCGTSTTSSPSSTRRGCGSRRSTSEPAPLVWIAGDRIDAAFAAIAAITGLKSPWLREHSTGVAELAEAAAWRMGLPAGLRHPRAPRRARARPRPGRRVERDLGEAGTARVRRVGARAAAPPLHRARLRPVAGARPDRAPGRLAPRAARRVRLPPRQRAGRRSIRPPASSPPPTATRAMREARPYRPALDAPAAEAELLREAEGGAARPGRRRRGARRRRPPRGRSDRASCPPGSRRASWRCCSRSCAAQSNQAIGDGLGISAKTVGHHVQHVYEKAGVRSRAAATLWAFEHDLVQTA